MFKLFNQLFIFLCLLGSVSMLWASDSRGNLSDTERCVIVNSQDIHKICYNLNFNWRFEPIAFKAKFRLEPSFKISRIHWKKHIDSNSSMAKKKQKNIFLGQSIFAAKVSANKWFIFTTQKIKQNKSSVQSQNLKWGKMVAKSCGDNNPESECSCFTKEANRGEKLNPFYISSATSKDLLRDGFELSRLKPCRLNISGIIKAKNTASVFSSGSGSSSDSSGNKKINNINEEVLYWNLIKRNPSLSKYQEYIKDYPHGQFVNSAKISIARYNKADAGNKINTQENAESSPIAICQSLLRKNQLTSGKSGNANRCFKDILAEEPDNIEAKSGLLSIEKRYVMWAKKALNSGNDKKTAAYIKKIELVNPDSSNILQLRQNIADKQSQSTKAVDDKLAKLQTAINDNDVKTAELLLTQLKNSNVQSSRYDVLNKQFIKVNSQFYYNTIKEDLNNKQLKKARLMLDDFKIIASDYNQYLELNNSYQSLLEEADKVHLKLTTDRSDSQVELNGIEQGNAPATLSLNKGEDYQVRITKKGYTTQLIKVNIYKDNELNIKMEESARSIINETAKTPVTAIPAAVSTPDIPTPYAANINSQNTVITDPSGIEMVSIQPGCFIMGSPRGEQRRDFDEKQHKICFRKGFKIGRYEITQQQWQAVMGRNSSYFDDCGANCPIEDIDWYEVQKFIKKLNGQSDLIEFGYRLPTEAEWEYAARAGTTTPYNTGSCLLPEQANYKTGKENCIKTGGQLLPPEIPSKPANIQNLAQGMTHPVGSYAPNNWGLYDMHGNVREWTCSEYFAGYNGSEKRCSVAELSITGAVDNSFQVSNRGGSWGYQYQWARSAERDKDLPTANNKNLGFRLVRP